MPVGPLLFIIAAEVLALMIDGGDKLRGIPVPGTNGTEVKVAAFVDDTAVYLRRAKMTAHLLDRLRDFEELSGLRVQPKKSVMISLNTTVTRKEYTGIPVLRPGEATRYLGVLVGHTDMAKENWTRRIASIKARLAIAI